MQIPLELLEQILFRLEASDLLRWKCVCKSLLQLISSPEFIQMHKNRSRTSIYLTIPHVIIDYENNPESFYSWQTTKRIPYSSEFSNGGMEIMGSCDGLICFLNRNCRKIVILNPSIRKSTSFDISDCSKIVFYWFGRHPCSDEYTLVIGRPNKIQVKKLYQDQNSSVSVDQEIHEVYPIFEKIGTLLHGSIHWPAMYLKPDGRVEKWILTYNFRENRISEISIPCESASCILGVLNGCLIAIDIDHRNTLGFELWVMKDYGLKESWFVHDRICGLTPSLVCCLGFSSDGDILIDAPGNFLCKYSFKNKKPILFQLHACKESRAIVLKDTLVSPDFIDRMI